ncbi:MAG TPA: aminopeptidase P family protein [Archaeoglobaceae archaeon]|nr:aminopeptidase P family protein [Archaeoglobaceae archaeon]
MQNRIAGKIREVLETNNANYFVLYSGSNNADFYYTTGFRISDPVFYCAGVDYDYLIVPEMEKNRALKESNVSGVLSLNDLNFSENLKELKDAKKALAQTLLEFLKSKKVKKLLIPPDFPSVFSFYFKDNNIDIEIVESPFSELRAVKNEKEIQYIKETSKAVISGFEYLIKLLKQGIRNCDELRDKLELFLFSSGYIARHTIVASGITTSDPHNVGKGKVEKHLIADIFPKNKKTGYYSDFTRTIIVERDEEIENMLDAVIEAKREGLSLIGDGVLAKDIHNAVCDVLEERGYHTLRGKSREGFIHSTGHGVGLEVHEKPSIYINDEILRSGMVCTIEPGLYYRKLGGVRVEDTVVVKDKGCEILTKYKDRIDLNE